jgi:hypothetical protein
MIPQVDVISEPTERYLAALTGQLPFATSLAINNTAKDFQRRQREHMGRVFTVRRAAWVRRAVKIKPFSTKYRLQATVAINAPGGRGDILAAHETRHVKRPRGRSLAIPEDVRTSNRQVVPKTKRPKAFQFQLVGTGPGGARMFRGKRRTFMIQRSDGTGGIYQRTGTKGSKRKGVRGAGRRMASDVSSKRSRDMNLKTLYRFTPHATVDDRLDFIFIGEKVIGARFGPNFKSAIERAMRGKGQSGPSRQQRRIARADVFGADRGRSRGSRLPSIGG